MLHWFGRISALLGVAVANIEHFGYYWAMQDGTADESADNPRNCSRPSTCSWDHANVGFVQNSWKNPNRWSPSGSTDWDIADVLQLQRVGLRSVVSVSHVFTDGPAGVLRADYAERWTSYVSEFSMSGALKSVMAWYPSDEPDLRMQASTLAKITEEIKAQSSLPVLVTLSPLAINETTGGLNYELDTEHVDILTFDIYSSGTITWPMMVSKLDVLVAVVRERDLSMALIPDATGPTYKSIGPAANVVLNDQFVSYCYAEPRCVGLFPFIGGHWPEILSEGAVYASLSAVADAVRFGEWRGTAIDPGLVCDDAGAKLWHLPCVAGGCNSALVAVFGVAAGPASQVLPSRQISMARGDIWQYGDECREIVSTWGAAVACSGESVACWQGIQNDKSRSVDCASIRNYLDRCNARDVLTGETNVSWTCCAPIESDESSDGAFLNLDSLAMRTFLQ